MIQQNNNIKDTLLSGEYISSLPISEFNGTPYVTMESIQEFMQDKGIDNVEIVVEDLIQYNNLSDLIIESLDMDAVEHAASGYQQMDRAKNKISALILNRNFDDVGELDRYIAECNRALDSIKEEKKKVSDRKNNDSYKFTAKYFISLLNLMKALIISCINFNRTLSPVVKARSAYNAIQYALKLPSYISRLTMTFNQYDRLLDSYEVTITRIRDSLVEQRKKAAEDAKKSNEQLSKKEK